MAECVRSQNNTKSGSHGHFDQTQEFVIVGINDFDSTAVFATRIKTAVAHRLGDILINISTPYRQHRRSRSISIHATASISSATDSFWALRDPILGASEYVGSSSVSIIDVGGHGTGTTHRDAIIIHTLHFLLPIEARSYLQDGILHFPASTSAASQPFFVLFGTAKHMKSYERQFRGGPQCMKIRRNQSGREDKAVYGLERKAWL